MTWSPIEVAAILLVWFPLVLPMILTPYFLTILSANVLGAGSYAVVQDADERGARLWFGFLAAVFTTVVVAGIILLAVTAPRM